MQSAIDIRRKIDRGELTAEAAVSACFDEIAQKDGEIGAFAALADRESAVSSAKQAKGPLAGIAFGVKDIFDTADLATTYGSEIYAGHQPLADAALVAMARRAGATIIGKTVSTEFAFLNPAKTRNPVNTAHTPGGSSSGSAAAIAAGMLPAACGTQTGGSIIRPASYCGIAGYKPSFRLLPVSGAKTFAWTLDTAGLFAASVADVAFLAAALTSRDLAVEAVEPKTLRLGLYRSRIWNEASSDMQNAVEKAAESAAQAGATIIELDEPETLAAARDVHSTVQNYEAGRALAGDFAQNAHRMSKILRETIAEGLDISPDTYDDGRAVARHARHAMTGIFGEIDALLTPSAPGAAPHGIESTGNPVFNKLWTLTGNPCVNIPGLSDKTGLPLGVQLVGRFGRDRRALSIAHWLKGLIGQA